MIPHRLLQLLEHLRSAVQKTVIAKYFLTNHVCIFNIITLCNNGVKVVYFDPFEYNMNFTNNSCVRFEVFRVIRTFFS